MVWARRMFFALILLLMACPVSAAVERFSDDKGVIHITNQGGEKPRSEERTQKAAPAPRRSPRVPVAPPAQEAEQPKPTEPEEPAKPNSYLTVRKGVIRITNVADRQGCLAQAGPPAPQVAPERPAPPEGQAEPPTPPVIPAALAALPANPAPMPITAQNPVSTYKDRQGVVHISNAAPARRFANSMVAGWSSPPAGQTASAIRKSEHLRPRLARQAEPDVPIQRVAFTAPESDDGLPGVQPFLANAPAPPSRADAKVRRFRDAKGVLHIVGRGSARGNHLQAPPVPAGGMMAYPPFPSAGRLRGTYPDRAPGASPPAWQEPTILVRKNKQGKLVIGNAPAKPLLSVMDKEEVRRRLEPLLVEASFVSGLPVSLLEAVIKVESDFQPAAVSPKGAQGLMQLMPGTAKFLRVEDPFCPRENILGGARYLRLLLDFFGQSLPLALAAYNAGFQRVIDSGFQVPDIKETQEFVSKVMGHFHLRQKQRYYDRRLIL